MTEQEWLTSTEPEKMLRHLTHYDKHVSTPHSSCDGWHRRGTALVSNRKMRLFGCACCLINGSPLKDVDRYERDGGPAWGYDDARITGDVTFAKGWCAQSHKITLKPHRKADLWREIVGNPFLRFSIPPECLTPLVVQMARTIYDERAWRDLPILADALEEAGIPDCILVTRDSGAIVECSPQIILSHLRSKGTHVRGCWCLDMLLGLE